MLDESDLKDLSRLFWEYCKTFEDYAEFHKKKYTREEILQDIDNQLFIKSYHK